MKLLEKQFKFTNAIGFLVKFAFDNGYFLTVGDAYRDPRTKYGSDNSMHRSRLAMDFNLFVNGEYIQDSSHPAWTVLHTEWTRLGGARRIKGDANHFSFQHGKYR